MYDAALVCRSCGETPTDGATRLRLPRAETRLKDELGSVKITFELTLYVVNEIT